jgi:hypothetical protein
MKIPASILVELVALVLAVAAVAVALHELWPSLLAGAAALAYTAHAWDWEGETVSLRPWSFGWLRRLVGRSKQAEGEPSEV